MLKIGLLGYGKAGQAVARVLAEDARYELQWIWRQRATTETVELSGRTVPMRGLDGLDVAAWLDQHPVDALVDFSNADAVYAYGPAISQRKVMVVTAISGYSDAHIAYLRALGQHTRVLCSPNITLGINFLMMAAKILRGIAPFADVEVVEQHFKEKPEISGTARKIAASLNLEQEKVTSLRVGGIVGHHEVIFGFPRQTVRLIHDSIRREAFGTGAAFALEALSACPVGYYTFEDLLQASIRQQLLADLPVPGGQ